MAIQFAPPRPKAGTTGAPAVPRLTPRGPHEVATHQRPEKIGVEDARFQGSSEPEIGVGRTSDSAA